MSKSYKHRSREPLAVRLGDAIQEIFNFLMIQILQRRSIIKVSFSENQSNEEKVFQRESDPLPNEGTGQRIKSSSDRFAQGTSSSKGRSASQSVHRAEGTLIAKGQSASQFVHRAEGTLIAKGQSASQSVHRAEGTLIAKGRSTPDTHRKIKGSRVWLRTWTTLLVVGFISHSLVIAISAAALVYVFPILKAKQGSQRRRRELVNAWPEILDLMISGLHSGLSIAESIEGLETRGPELTRELFKECKEMLRSDGDMKATLALIKTYFDEAMADQICEVLDFARSTGSRDTTVTLRTLGNFIRSEIAMKEEIRVKHGWIRNSAAVASVAPWLLLSVLWLQPNTRAAYSTAAGAAVLVIGVVMSLLAFLWMHRAGRLPETPRVFQ